MWTESYTPHGERLNKQLVSNKIWYTSRHQDEDTGLVYMGARYYDPVTGRFTGVDPKLFNPADIHTFNRYSYANNNAYRNIDPDGRVSVPVALGVFTVLAVGGTIYLNDPQNRQRVVQGLESGARWLQNLLSENSQEGEKGKKPEEEAKGKGKTSGNTNPYDGPVDEPVIVVDPSGNAIPVGKGERITTSPNGDYQQVRGADGQPTGVRLDRGGHRDHKDPSGREPHAHRPGVLTPDGNPHLPINSE